MLKNNTWVFDTWSFLQLSWDHYFCFGGCFWLLQKRSTLLQKSKINLNAFPPKAYRNRQQQKTTKRTAPHNKNPSARLSVYLEPKWGPLVLIGVFFLFWGDDLQKQRSIRVPAVRIFPSPKIWRVSNPNFLHPETPRFTMQNRGAGLKVSSWWRILAEAWKTKFISINKWNSLKTSHPDAFQKMATNFSMISLGVFFFFEKTVLHWLGRGSGVFCFVRKV